MRCRYDCFKKIRIVETNIFTHQLYENNLGLINLFKTCVWMQSKYVKVQFVKSAIIMKILSIFYYKYFMVSQNKIVLFLESSLFSNYAIQLL